MVVLRIHRIQADAGQDHAVLLVDLQRNFADQFVNFIRGQRIRHFDMDRTIIPVRAVIMKNKIVRAMNFVKTVHCRLHLFNKLGVRTGAEELSDRLPQHVNTGLHDDNRNNCAEPCFQTHVENQIYHRRKQR